MHTCTKRTAWLMLYVLNESVSQIRLTASYLEVVGSRESRYKKGVAEYLYRLEGRKRERERETRYEQTSG